MTRTALLHSLAAVAGEYLQSGKFRNPLMRASLFHTLAVSTLECFRLSADPRERSRTPGDQQTRYHRAVDFIEDHASLPITVGDIASAAVRPSPSSTPLSATAPATASPGPCSARASTPRARS